MKFSPTGVLFVGDSRSATLFAFSLEASNTAQESNPFNIYNVDQLIANCLEAPLDHITVKDLAIHPLTKEAYIAVHYGHGQAMAAAIVKVNSAGKVQLLDLEKTPHTKITLKNPMDPDLKFWNGVELRTLTITDITYWQEEVFVSGLSNADFSSTLYRIPYPFKEVVETSSIEIYHAVHDQNETRAPIQTMTILPLNGKPHVLAAYTCTPMVTIPVDKLKDGAHVHGKTIAELGYGNSPIDIIHFQSQDMHGQTHDQVLVTNKNRKPMLFSVESLSKANQEEGLSSSAGFNVVAPDHMEIPLAGLIQVDNQDSQFLIALRRDMETGKLNLISFRKGIYFRLSDFVSEYTLPGYVYPESQQHILQFQQFLKKDEGFL